MSLRSAIAVALSAVAAPALAQGAPAVERVDAPWLAGQLKTAGVSVETALGAPDPIAARTELRGRDGGFVWKIFFYDCTDQVAAVGCEDYEYVAAAELDREDAAKVTAWSARQRFARASMEGQTAILRFSLSVAGGVGAGFPAAQHQRWLEAAADLARALDSRATAAAPDAAQASMAAMEAAAPPAPPAGAAATPDPAAPIATAPPAGGAAPALVPDPPAQTTQAPVEDREE